ncbi:Crp/Fnr family transcriptional regulator [Salibacterium sp. K-3]
METPTALDKMWYLSNIGFFEFLSPEDLEYVAAIIHHQRVKKHTLLQRPENAEQKLYFVKEGAVRIYDLNEDGELFTLSIMGPYSTYGRISSFSMGTDEVYVETLSDVYLCSITEEQFAELAGRCPDVMYRAMQMLSKRLEEKEKMLQVIATGTVKEQIMHLLVSLADTYGKHEYRYVEIPIPLSHQEIANMLGVTRESVSHNMRKLRNERFLRSTRRRTIEVRQHAALSEM